MAMGRYPNGDGVLTALLISPDRDLSSSLERAFASTRLFEVLAELKSYPPEQTLEIRLRQIQPDVVLVDVATDVQSAEQLLRFLATFQPATQAVAIHHGKQPDILIRSLRAGAVDFLHTPFDPATQAEVAQRIRRMREPAQAGYQEIGKVLAFSSTKPGSGASTLAVQMAYTLKRVTGQRVLLADFDVMGGSVAFALKINPTYSLADALERTERLDPGLWSSLVHHHAGVDVLPAPETPPAELPQPGVLHEVIEYARGLYDWVIVDLPSIFQRTSLYTLSEADQMFLVTTPELPSLHLTRRAAGLLLQFGFDKDRFRIVVNRTGKRDNITTADMETIFGCGVFAALPNDFYALHRVMTRADVLPADSALGRSIEQTALRVAGAIQKERRSPAVLTPAPQG
jgi:pilus assembly protein CpaE